MNQTLLSETFPNAYAQISLIDAGTSDLPEWGTGDEPSVASEHALYLSTRPDTAGAVEVHVLYGKPEEQADAKEVFVGRLRIDSGSLEVGSPLAGAVQTLDFAAIRELSVVVLARPAHEPSEIWAYVVDPEDAAM